MSIQYTMCVLLARLAIVLSILLQSLSLNSNILQLLSWSIPGGGGGGGVGGEGDLCYKCTPVASPVVKEQLLSGLDVPLGVDAYSMVPVDHHDLGKAVWMDGVVGKPDLVSLTSCIHYIVWRGESITDEQVTLRL